MDFTEKANLQLTCTNDYAPVISIVWFGFQRSLHFPHQFFSTKAEGLTNRTRGLVGSLLFRTPLR